MAEGILEESTPCSVQEGPKKKMFSTGRTEEKENEEERKSPKPKESKSEGIYLKFIDLQFNEFLIVKFKFSLFGTFKNLCVF